MRSVTSHSTRRAVGDPASRIGKSDDGPGPRVAAFPDPARARSTRALLNDSYMSDIAVSQARDHLAAAIEQARTGETVYVTRRGRRVAVIIGAEDYDDLVERAEDIADRAELQAAREEDDFIPWEQVKAELGLT